MHLADLGVLVGLVFSLQGEPVEVKTPQFLPDLPIHQEQILPMADPEHQWRFLDEQFRAARQLQRFA